MCRGARQNEWQGFGRWRNYRLLLLRRLCSGSVTCRSEWWKYPEREDVHWPIRLYCSCPRYRGKHDWTSLDAVRTDKGDAMDVCVKSSKVEKQLATGCDRA